MMVDDQPAARPGAAASRHVRAARHDWHVRIEGVGPTLLLVHGTGGSLHSWDGLIAELRDHARLIAVDLPGHGSTRIGTSQRSGLPQMAADLGDLMKHLNERPLAVIGHSAGGAIAMEMAERLDLRAVVGINPALAPFRGLASVMFPMAARMLSVTPFMVDALLRPFASEDRVRAILKGTGSDISPEGIRQYASLFRNRDHLHGTLAMMAAWDLEPLLAKLPEIATPTLFLCGGRDKTTPPDIALDAAAALPAADVHVLETYGHLMHEEAPDKVAAFLRAWLWPKLSD